MNFDKKILKQYLDVNICPVLLEDVNASFFKDAIILDSLCDVSELNGHYEGINFLPPKWYDDLVQKSKKGTSFLVINQINNVPLNMQGKFNEILKYRKISTFELPENCRIIVTCQNLKEKKIASEVYSLLAHI